MTTRNARAKAKSRFPAGMAKRKVTAKAEADSPRQGQGDWPLYAGAPFPEKMIGFPKLQKWMCH
jgi:hypothetical protein